MSKTIDDRVVEMRFDNKQFESNVQTSINTLGKLKDSLNLSGAAKGLENVDKAARGIDMSGLSSAVQTVQSKFSALEVVGITALANITNSAVNTGKQLIASLSIDQITAGWNKYGQKTASVQTIMNATGKSIDEVNGYLDKLMWFSDETSYGFTDMTAALGQLTSAGGDIEKLIPMITGIANATAYAGKGSSEFSRAIYNLNQSYSAGSLQYMDWKSLELAGIASKELKQTFIDTAVEMGKIEDGEVTIANFGQTLKDKWADTEVMEKAFGKFGEMTEKAYEMVQNGEVETASEAYAKLAEKYDGVAITAAKAAQEAKTFGEAIDATKDAVSSGWMKTFELIFGNYEEAKKLWTDLANSLWDVFASGADARNEMLAEWKELGGRDDLIESFWNIWDAIASIIKPIKEAFRDIFPPMTAERLAAFTKALKEFTAKLTLSDSASDKLKRTFKGLFAILSILKQALSAVLKAIFPMFDGLGSLGGGILSVTAKIGDWLVKLNDLIKSSGIFNKVMQGIATVVRGVGRAIKVLIDFIKEKLIFPGFEAFHAFLERVHERMSGLTSVAESARDGIVRAFDGIGSALTGGGFYKFLQTVWKVIKTIGAAIGKVLGSVASFVIDKLGNADFDGIVDLLNGLLTGGLLAFILKFVKGLSSVTEAASGFKDGIINILDGVRGCFTEYQKQIKSGTLMKIAKAIAILTASILVLSLIDSEKLETALSAITVLFAELLGSMAIFTKISGKFSGVTRACTAMISMSIAVLILAGALKSVSSLNMDEIGRGLLGVAGLMGIVIAAVAAMSKFMTSSEKMFSLSKNGIFSSRSKKNFVSMGIAMIAIATSMKILASAAKDLASLDWEQLARGVAGIGVILGEVAGFMALVKIIKPEKMISTSIGMIAIAAAMKIFASAAKDFAEMNWEELGKAGAAIAGILLAVAGFSKLMGSSGGFLSISKNGFFSGKSSKNLLSTGVALIAIAAAMKIFASAAQDMAELSWEEIGKGLVAMASSLTAVALATKIMPKNLVAKGLGLIAVAAALKILASVMSKLSGMSWEGIAKGLVSLGGAMAILAIALHAMKGTLAGSAALLVASMSLAVLAPTLALLGAMKWSSIAKGLITIAAAFAIIGIAGYALAPVVGPILALSAALALIGVAALGVGVGLAAIGIGLSVFAGSLAAIAGSLGLIVSTIIAIVKGVVVGIIEGVGEGIVALCKIIAESATSIGEALKAVILTLVDVLVECAPPLADGALKLVAALLEALVNYTPQIVDALFDFVIKVIEGLGRNIPRILVAITDLLGQLFKGVVDAIANMDPEVFIQGSLAIGLLAGMMAALAGVAALTPGAMAGVLGVVAVLAEFGALAQIPGLSWLIGEGKTLFQNIGEAIGGFVGGIVGGFMGGVTDSFPKIASNLSEFMTNIQPFIDGAQNLDPSMLDGVNALIATIMALTGANILDAVASWFTGGHSLAEFGEEIEAFAPSLRAYADAVAGIDTDAVETSAAAAKALADMTSYIPNEGGVISWFAGENSISKFGDELPILGAGLKGFSDAVNGIIPENLIAASEAAKALAIMADSIPNEGGVVSWFAGENSISKFGSDLIALGMGLKGFSDAIAGIVPENLIAAANAAKPLAEMTASIPNEGGVLSWFAGENSISKFGSDLIALGMGLKGFSDQIAGIVPENTMAGASAAKALAEMASYIPNEGGVISWFAGENSISKFGSDLIALGAGLKGFSDAIAGINPENVTAAANAAKTLAEMSSYIPNEGGIKTWFVGESSISKFGSDLIALGTGLKGFSDAIAGIVPENVTAAANSAKALAEMASYIPNEGGVKAWFTGKSSVASFANKLPDLGAGLKAFSDNVTNISPENVAAAAGAAKSLAEMTSVIPKEGGIKAWFSGKTSIANFADKLPGLGDALSKFSESVAGISPENVSSAASAAKSLAEMTSIVPKKTDKLVNFGKNLETFGTKLSSYFSNTSGITSESVSAANKAIESIEKATSLNSGNIKSLAKAIDSIVDSIKGMAKITETSAANFKRALKELGETSVETLMKPFKKLKTEMEKAGETAMTSFASGVDKKINKAESAFENVVTESADAAKSGRKEFESAGAYLVSGFASGISANAYKAAAKAKAMAAAAASAAKKELDEHSPSKVGYQIGDFFGVAFVNAIAKYSDKAYDAGSEMASSARSGLKNAIGKIQTVINGDIGQPTIRPVLDLSDVRAGAGSISEMLNMKTTLGVLGDTYTISSMMNRRNQNGANEELISAIDKLRKDIGSTGNTYQIDSITYDDGSNISDAVKSLVRAARVERRT